MNILSSLGVREDLLAVIQLIMSELTLLRIPAKPLEALGDTYPLMSYPHGIRRKSRLVPFVLGDKENDENKIGHALRGRFRFDARPNGVWGSARAGTGAGGPGGPGGTRPSTGSGTGGAHADRRADTGGTDASRRGYRRAIVQRISHTGAGTLGAPALIRQFPRRQILGSSVSRGSLPTSRRGVGVLVPDRPPTPIRGPEEGMFARIALHQPLSRQR